MYRPRLLLADDHPETVEHLRVILQLEFDVVGDVHDGTALVAAVEDVSPDAIVSDISMPGLDGIRATKAILRRDPTARIVLVTVDTEASLMERGLEAGALGYVSKLTAGDDLIPAVRAALCGKRYVGRSFFCADNERERG